MVDPEDTEKTRPAGERQVKRDEALPESLRALIGRQLAGCTIDRALGKGSMGAVFRGTEHALGGRFVAIKVLLPEYAEQPAYLGRFQREAAVAAGLDSDHVVKIFRHGRQGPFPYLVMELVEGGTLLQQANGKCPPASEVVRQLAQACEGLLAAERKGLVHRDIKPANIMLARRQVGRGGRGERVDVKIVDFGVARPATNLAATQPGTFIGSPLYASPEQWENASEVTHASDMYSLGATFYHLLVGKAAPPGRSEGEVRTFTLRQPHLSPREANPEVPEELDAVIRKLTARLPQDRYASFADVIVALQAISDKPRIVPAGHDRTQPRRSNLLGVALSVAALAALAVYVWPPPAPVANEARDSVVQLIGQARPNGALSLRLAELRTVGPLPPALAEDPAAKAVRDRVAAIEARVALLRGLEQQGLQRRDDVDWAAVLAGLDVPRGALAGAEIEAERADLTRLREALAAYAALQSDLHAIDNSLANLRERLTRADLDFGASLREAEEVRTRCGDRPTHAERAQAAAALIDELRAEQACTERVRACAAKVEAARLSFKSVGVEQLRSELQDWLAWPMARGACSSAELAALKPRYESTKQALDQALALATSWQRALAHDGGFCDFVAAAVAAWPDVSDGLLGDWCRHQASLRAAEFVERALERLDVGVPSVPAEASTWLDAAGRALDAPGCRKILAAKDGSEERLKRRLEALRAGLQPSPKAATPVPEMPDGLPPTWPRERGDQAFYKRLRVRRVGDEYVFQFNPDGGDDVDMLLVQQPGVEPFLIDVMPVTYDRLCRSGLFVGPAVRDYARFLTDSGATEEQRRDSLVVEIIPDLAEKYAERVGKALPTFTQWRAIEQWLGARAPTRMGELHLELRSRTPCLPRSFAWPGSAGKPHLFAIGVRDLVRGEGGYQAVGHTLFSPKDRVMTPLEADAALAYYRAEPLPEPVTARYRANHIGFRCAVPLPPER